MDYSKAYTEETLEQKFETYRKKHFPEKIWLNKCCPKCKSTEFTAITEDDGSQMWCVCGHHYIRFTWENEVIHTKNWINRACPSCKSTKGYAYTNDGGSQFVCECGKIYQRFKYA
jgi:phage FluMu protein Com